MKRNGDARGGGRRDDVPSGRRPAPEPRAPGDHGAPGGPGGPDDAGDASPRLPLLPGFREMALRRMSADRGRLVRDLAARRQQAGLSQTEVAARMGTSQSAVARLESGEANVRAATLERYAAAIGAEITWKLQDLGRDESRGAEGVRAAVAGSVAGVAW